MIGFFRTLAARVARFFSRRTARKLVAADLPKGLPPPAAPFTLALRVPPALDDAPDGEFRTLPLGAQSIRGQRPARLFRLAALPPPPHELSVVRPIKFRPLAPVLRVPSLLRTLQPIASRVIDLGVARPRHLRLDDELRLPVEVDPLRTAADAPPPARERRVRPRTPLARAPLGRIKPRNFRLDPRSGEPANECILPLEPRDTSWRWLRADFRREKVDLPWMARNRIPFLGPLQSEWFLMWWDEYQDARPGAKEPYPYDLARELDEALQQCKEQILIRRDVKKDESEQEEGEYGYVEFGMPIAAYEAPPLPSLLPAKQWVEKTKPIAPPPLDRAAREAYLQWRTLVDALEER